MMNTIVYIGDFDIRNENVQSHLVLNNGKIFRRLGYKTVFIGTNRKCEDFRSIEELDDISCNEFLYYELPHTLTATGIVNVKKIRRKTIQTLESINKIDEIRYVITYQAPTYSIVLKDIVRWCQENDTRYIVNCADITVFSGQSILRRIVMEINWKYLHWITYNNADGVIAVSSYIDTFYQRKGRPSVVVPPLFDMKKSYAASCSHGTDVTFVYAGTPFPLTKRCINPKGMKDRIDKIIALFLTLSNEISNARLLIIGFEKSDYCYAVPEQSEALENCNAIHFLGRKSHEDTLKYVANSDFMINFRDTNKMTLAGLSTKLVESVSVGTPVVMNDIGDSFRYLNIGKNGYMLTGDFGSDVRLLEALCAIPRNDLDEKKKECMKCNPFSIDAFEGVYQEFFRDVDRIRISQ